MVRTLYVSSFCVLVAAGAVLFFCMSQWQAGDSKGAAFLAEPSAIQLFQKGARQQGKVGDGRVSPLVAQAKVLAAHLDPPNPPVSPQPASAVLPKERAVAKTVSRRVRREQAEAKPLLEPRGRSVKFSVRATSYYADRPGKSMALIAEPGGKAGSERWVREGHKLGHFVVHEIRQGAVVFRQGQDLKEVAVDRPQGPKDLVTAVHSPPMPEIGDRNTEKPSPEGDRQDPNGHNPLEPKVMVSEGGR